MDTTSAACKHQGVTLLSRGVTLIELMAVVAIIAILALMAVPSYHDKYIREQVIEAMRLTDIAKAPIATARQGRQ